MSYNQCCALGSHFGIPTWDLGWDLGSQRGIPKMGWDFWTLQGSLLSNPYTKSEGGRPSHPRILGKLPEKGIPSTKYHLGSQMGSHRFLGSHMGYHLGSQHCCTDHKHTAGLQADTHVVLRSATNIYSEYSSLSPIRARDPGVEEVRYVKFGK